VNITDLNYTVSYSSFLTHGRLDKVNLAVVIARRIEGVALLINGSRHLLDMAKVKKEGRLQEPISNLMRIQVQVLSLVENLQTKRTKV